MAPRFWCAAAVLALVVGSVARGDESAGLPLHVRIDKIVENAAIGPLSPPTTDADFVRRVYLDLTGVIPTVDEAQAFVADRARDKRQRLIDQLLANSAFNRHLAITLDVMLMERKPDKVIKQPEWEAFLYNWLADEKPLDRLFQELIASDGVEEKERVAARFVLDRDAEPNLLTRDIGRIALGMDLQCCQCHDHPLIDDYFQADYYGLFAFVQRTSLFTDAKTKLVSLTEKADGEASFKSVFTGAANDRALPQVPKGAVLFIEPRFRSGEEYQVKPDKTVRGIPKFSRRDALAEMLPTSREFARNLANRLWAVMLGRGIVHPLDFHHAANPPSNPALLALLADELSAGHFQLRPFLREIALSKSYQRSCDAPRSETINIADIKARLENLRREKAAQQQSIQRLKDELTIAKAGFKTIQTEDAQRLAEISKLEKAVTENRQSLDKATAERKAQEETIAKLQAANKTLVAAQEKLNALVSKLPAQAELAETLAAVGPALAALNNSVVATESVVANKAAAERDLANQLAELESGVVNVVKARPSIEGLRKPEQRQIDAEHQLAEANFATKLIDAQIALATAIVEHAALRATDPVKAETAWASIVERWTIAGQVAPLKPLTAEELGFSAMQATGMLAPQFATAEAKLKKAPPESLKKATEEEKPRLQPRLAQLELLTELRKTMQEFVRQYGGQPGEEFQATVNQALYFGNGGVIDGWLKPTGDNLANRLAKVEDTQHIAEELSWAIFSRPATEAERQTVSDYLKNRDDKVAAIGEIAWSLLASTEFRFNH
jgi:hypothetical protein